MAWFFDTAPNIWFQETFPWMEVPFKIITYLGDAIIFIALLSIAFWTFKKKEAIIAIYVLLTSSFLNFFLKVLIQNPRPPQEIRLVEETGFSTPSDHAQTSSAMYGWIMLYFKKIWLYIVTPIIVILISLSRVFLGVHYLGDVIIGLLVGTTLLIGLYFGIPPLVSWMERKWPDWVKVTVGVSYGLVVFFITFFLGLYAPWPEGDMTNSANICAALIFVPVAVWIEAKWIKMKNEGIDWRSKLLRVGVGLILVIGSYFGLTFLFDLISTDNYSLLYLIRFVKYFIVLLIATLVMPFVFSRVKWFSNEKIVMEAEEAVEEREESQMSNT